MTAAAAAIAAAAAAAAATAAAPDPYMLANAAAPAIIAFTTIILPIILPHSTNSDRPITRDRHGARTGQARVDCLGGSARGRHGSCQARQALGSGS